MVTRIFEAFAAGRSPRDIARELNHANIPGPSGRAWRDTTIRRHTIRRTGILRNELYVGRRVWNKLRYGRHPVTGRRVSRLRPVEEWIVREVADLAIIRPELWQQVQDRLDRIRTSVRSEKIQGTEFWKARRPRHLLTGLIHCHECDRAMSAAGKDYLAGSAARTGAGCSNRRGARRDRIESAVLDGLKNRLMAPELVEEFSRAVIAETNACRRDLEQGQAQ